MKGRNGSTSFFAFKQEGWIHNKLFSEKCLTEEQTKYVYDNVELGDELKVRKVSQDIQNKLLLPKQLIERRDTNLYEKLLVSDVNTMDKNKSQIEQWSILGNNIVYVRSVGNEDMNRIDIKMVDY